MCTVCLCVLIQCLFPQSYHAFLLSTIFNLTPRHFYSVQLKWTVRSEKDNLSLLATCCCQVHVFHDIFNYSTDDGPIFVRSLLSMFANYTNKVVIICLTNRIKATFFLLFWNELQQCFSINFHSVAYECGCTSWLKSSDWRIQLGRYNSQHPPQRVLLQPLGYKNTASFFFFFFQ